ncbi:LysR family transcriptional regulator [Enterobacter hormaechei]|nr:LysR family transcriptional regulator [Enterobacter hormaechei]
MNKIRLMEVYVAVVEEGSLSHAAKRLDISAVMVGKAIAELEKHLRIRLLNRNTRRQVMTNAGKVWYAESLSVLATLKKAENRIESLRDYPEGSLRISSAVTLGTE